MKPRIQADSSKPQIGSTVICRTTGAVGKIIGIRRGGDSYIVIPWSGGVAVWDQVRVISVGNRK